MKNLKTTMIAALLMLAAVSSALAQEKWEYATVSCSWAYQKLSVSIDGKEFYEEKMDLPKPENKEFNSNPLLNKIHELENKGWESVSVTCGSGTAGNTVYFAYLKRKKP
jgi:hypothetical protein